MNAQNVQSADYLDILFDGRNKDYGAYLIRRYYNKRLAISVMIVLSGCMLFFLFIRLYLPVNTTAIFEKPGGVVELIEWKDPIKPPVAVVPARSQARQVHSATIVIVPEEEITDPVLQVTELDNSVIGLTDIAGKDEVRNISTVLATEAAGVSPVINSDPAPEIIWTITEIPARFPGDWKRYLERNLDYPEVAIEKETQGMVKLQFIVDREGAISEITVLNDPGDCLAEEAIRIIRSGPKWKPAEQNGRIVISRHIQTITFRLQ